MRQRRTWRVAVTLWLVLGWTLPAGAQPADADRYWGQWRGPEANGVARHADPPLTWSETEHVAWKVEVPGRGSASPIVWGDKVFLLTAVPIGDPATAGRGGCPVATPGAPGTRQRSWCPRWWRRPRWRRCSVEVRKRSRCTGSWCMAFDRETGAVVWERVAREERCRTRGISIAERDLRLRVGGHRRRAALCVLRFVGTVCLRSWTANCSGRSISARGYMRNAFGEGSTPALLRRHAGGDLGPHRRPVVRRGASTRARGRNGGDRTGTRSTPGPRRSSSSTRGARR